MEVWKQIPCLQGVYEASSLGRIRRVLPNTTRTSTRGRTARLGICTTITNAGYEQVTVWFVSLSKWYSCKVHQLVASAFHGACPSGKEVNHKDFNRLNNHPSNLEYSTHKENMLHAIRGGRIPRGDGHKSSKLTSIQVIRIRKLYATGLYSHRSLGVMFGINSTVICDIVNQTIWQHV